MGWIPGGKAGWLCPVQRPIQHLCGKTAQATARTTQPVYEKKKNIINYT